MEGTKQEFTQRSPMAGLPVCKKHGDAVYVPLPPELWGVTMLGGCTCGNCDGEGYWDTLAISTDRAHSATWTVHYPALHGRKDLYVELAARAPKPEGK